MVVVLVTYNHRAGKRGYIRSRLVCRQFGRIWKYMLMNGELIRCGSCGCEIEVPKIEYESSASSKETESDLPYIVFGYGIIFLLAFLPHSYLFEWVDNRFGIGAVAPPYLVAFLAVTAEAIFLLGCIHAAGGEPGDF